MTRMFNARTRRHIVLSVAISVAVGASAAPGHIARGANAYARGAAAKVQPAFTAPNLPILAIGGSGLLTLHRPSGLPSGAAVTYAITIAGARVANIAGKSQLQQSSRTGTISIMVRGAAYGSTPYSAVARAAGRSFTAYGTIWVGSKIAAPPSSIIRSRSATGTTVTVSGALLHVPGAVLVAQAADPGIANVVSFQPISVTALQPSVPLLLAGNRPGTTRITVLAGVPLTATVTLPLSSTLPLTDTTALTAVNPFTATAVLAPTASITPTATITSTSGLQPSSLTTTALSVKVVGPAPSVFTLQTSPITVTGAFTLASRQVPACGPVPVSYSSQLIVGIVDGQLSVSVPSDSGSVSLGAVHADGSFVAIRDGESFQGRMDKTGAGVAYDTYGYDNCVWTYRAVLTPLKS